VDGHSDLVARRHHLHWRIYKNVVKLTFSKGASLKDPAVSSTRVSTETHAARSTSSKEKKLTSPPSRRSFAKRSPSTVLASRNLRESEVLRDSALEQVDITVQPRACASSLFSSCSLTPRRVIHFNVTEHPPPTGPPSRS